MTRTKFDKTLLSALIISYCPLNSRDYFKTLVFIYLFVEVEFLRKDFYVNKITLKIYIKLIIMFTY